MNRVMHLIMTIVLGLALFSACSLFKGDKGASKQTVDQNTGSCSVTCSQGSAEKTCSTPGQDCDCFCTDDGWPKCSRCE